MKAFGLNQKAKYVKQGIQNHKAFHELINKNHLIQEGKKKLL